MSDNDQNDSESRELVTSKKKFESDKSIKQLSLHEIVAKNDVQQLRYLLDLRQNHGVNIDLNKKNDENNTPLHVAAISNEGQSHFEISEMLMNNGADPDARDKWGQTPLWCLLENPCNLEILKLFLKFNPDLTDVDGRKTSILRPAVFNGDNLDVVKFLVEDMGLDVNHRDIDNWTPLHTATIENSNDSHYEVLKYLLGNGVDVNFRNSAGCTPFFYLFRKGNWRVIELFLKYNADLQTVNNWGRSILFAFNDKISDEQVLEKMICDLNLNVNHTDENKRTPLHSILECIELTDAMNIKVVKCFLKNGADINACDIYGLTPLINIVHLFKQKPFDEEYHLKNLDYFNFIIDQTDFSVVHNNQHIFCYIREDQKYLRDWILQHLAKLEFLNIPVHPIIQKFIENHIDYKDYFKKCTEELEAMKNSKPKNSWITFFNLLVDNRRKLKNYAGNEDLIEDYENKDWLKMFPIYGASMKKSVKKGLARRKLFDKSSILLSECVPIFNCTHLIFKDILDCDLSKKDLSKLCE